MDKGFEVRVARRPGGGWEVVLVMVDDDVAVNGLLCCISNLAVDEQHFLVDLENQ